MVKADGRIERRRRPLDLIKEAYPEKFADENTIFSHIQKGDRIYISTACGEPQYLINALTNYTESNPKAFVETELLHVWTLGVAPWSDQKFDNNFRHNSFFIGNNTREAVNAGLADYTPIFLSRIPKLFRTKMIPIDVALIQTSMPDLNGYVSLGISVDITKAALENARMIIAQVNPKMPRIHGDTFIHTKDIDFLVYHDEKLLEYSPHVPNDIADQIGNYVSRIVNDGDTIQLGYGSLPNAILNNMQDKKHLGIHTELLTDSMVELMKQGVIDNSRKTLDRGKSIAAFSMGTENTYKYLNDNPAIEFRQIGYTNNPLIIAQQHRMTAINTALQIDLTGQATAESINNQFFSGIGGSTDFMRGAILSPEGKTILVLQSTAQNGTISRIVPFLKEGAGVTMNRGDIHYVVSEYGIAYIHGKNIRERAMDLIAIAHPKFRAELIEEAKKKNLIYKDQAYIPGKKGEYPENIETIRTTPKGLTLQFRPVRINDETLVKDFFHSLSDQSLKRRYMSPKTVILHKERQDYVVIDYTRELVILATIEEDGKEKIIGMGQILYDDKKFMAEVAFAVRDHYHNNGIGSELLSYMTVIAKRDGLQGFTAEVLLENQPMLHVFEKMDYDMHKRMEDGIYELVMKFKQKDNE